MVWYHVHVAPSGVEIYYPYEPAGQRTLLVHVDEEEHCWTSNLVETGKPNHPPGAGWQEAGPHPDLDRTCWRRRLCAAVAWLTVRFKEEDGVPSRIVQVCGDWTALDPTQAMTLVARPRWPEDVLR